MTDKRPVLNKLLDPLCDPVPKSYKKIGGKQAKKVYYESEDAEYRSYKEAQYCKFVLKLPFLVLFGILFGRLLAAFIRLLIFNQLV